MGKKESSQEMSSLAGRILLHGYEPTREEIESLAASVASQDETRGERGRPTKPTDADEPPEDTVPPQSLEQSATVYDSDPDPLSDNQGEQ